MPIALVWPDWTWLWLPLGGVLAGFLGGLLGVGGGLVILPVLILTIGEDAYGPGSLHVYKLAALSTTIVVSLPAAIRHARARAVITPMLYSIVPLSLVGALTGVALAALFSAERTHVLRRIFGGFLLLVVVANFLQGRWAASRSHTLQSCPMPQRWGLIGSVIGIPAGFIGGLLGIGGGVWAVPALYLGMGVRLRHAIATSAGMIVFVGGFAALAQTWSVARMPELSAWSGWVLALWLAPGAVLGGWCGAAMTHRLPTQLLRNAFYGLLALTGLRLMFA